MRTEAFRDWWSQTNELTPLPRQQGRRRYAKTRHCRPLSWLHSVPTQPAAPIAITPLAGTSSQSR
jgi:hypothetical protein